ncbi:basic proline-rich protein-like [Frankliniella occidentalis]|uniref:Regulatory protein zeste n=1 Tax=Frankliniella occidentalis TaxID=133901 RepID=A0A6J1T8F3_FRAOC|nr:basic proline-rich protein-like [Frankliniella occidentalis]
MTANNQDPTNQQWSALLDALHRFKVMRGDFTNEGAGAAGRHDELWAQTAHRLNQMGGAFKSWEKWKEAFNNLKGRAKRQYMERARHVRGTGGGPPLPEDLEPEKLGMNPIYCRVMAFVPREQLFGHDGVPDPLQMQMQQPVQAGQQQPVQAGLQQPVQAGLQAGQQPVQAMRPPPPQPQQHLGQVGHRPWLQHPLPGPERHAAHPGLGLGPNPYQPRHQVAHCVYPATLGVTPDTTMGATPESASGYPWAGLGSVAGPSTSRAGSAPGPGPSWAEPGPSSWAAQSSVQAGQSWAELEPLWAETSVPAPGPSVPAPGPSVPAPGPSVPAPGPSIPAPGPSAAAVSLSAPAPPVVIQGISELTDAVNLLTATLQSLDLRPEIDTTKLEETVTRFASTVDTLSKLG